MLGDRRQAGSAVVSGTAAAPYEPGLLALREGPLLEAALRALPEPPQVVLANASGRDHPRGAGLALHLGAALHLPSVGVTDRLLLATGSEPGPGRGATSSLMLDNSEVARSLRTRAGARPIVVHPGWRTEPRDRGLGRARFDAPGPHARAGATRAARGARRVKRAPTRIRHQSVSRAPQDQPRTGVVFLEEAREMLEDRSRPHKGPKPQA
jgi:hypothetical protein